MDSKVNVEDLSRYFPPLTVCQPWKTNFFLEKLVSASSSAIDNLTAISYKSPVFIDKRDLLEIYGSLIGLQRHVHDDLDASALPINVNKAVESILSKTNEYISRLDASPYFSELPFAAKSRIMEPMVDMRIFASNLKRSLKPCTLLPKPVTDPLTTSPLTPMTTLARGFL